MGDVIINVDFKARRIIKSSEQGAHCSQCKTLSDKVYQTSVFSNARLDFCSRDCVIAWNKVNTIQFIE